jgi:hypothetical protein
MALIVSPGIDLQAELLALVGSGCPDIDAELRRLADDLLSEILQRYQNVPPEAVLVKLREWCDLRLKMALADMSKWQMPGHA